MNKYHIIPLESAPTARGVPGLMAGDIWSNSPSGCNSGECRGKFMKKQACTSRVSQSFFFVAADPKPPPSPSLSATLPVMTVDLIGDILIDLGPSEHTQDKTRGDAVLQFSWHRMANHSQGAWPGLSRPQKHRGRIQGSEGRCLTHSIFTVVLPSHPSVRPPLCILAVSRNNLSRTRAWWFRTSLGKRRGQACWEERGSQREAPRAKHSTSVSSPLSGTPCLWASWDERAW